MTISGATQVLVLLGHPVAHSLSPLMHNGWIADHALDAVYVAVSLKTDGAVAAIRALKAFGFKGANVTVPHKQAAAAAADHSEAQVANVLRWEADGSLCAFNTDGPGFADALTDVASDWRTRVKRVLMVGAGGGAQAIARTLSPHVDTIHFVNRTSERGDAAALAIPNGRTLRWDDLERGFGAADLIVQATSLGMNGNEDIDWPVANIRAGAIVADIVYRPLETGLLHAARGRGLATVDGLGMLVYQGARAFEHWFGVMPDVAQSARPPDGGARMIIIGLTGSIGMGKSTVAKMFEEEGAPAFNADDAVHALYAKGGGAVAAVSAAFPSSLRDGAIDRAALSAAVIDNAEAIKQLEAIVHPLVRNAQISFLEKHRGDGKRAVVLDIPLLFESKAARTFDRIVVVSAPADVQRARVLARSGMTEDKLDFILSRQVPDAEKRAKADFVIDTTQALEDTREQVRAVLDAIREQG